MDKDGRVGSGGSGMDLAWIGGADPEHGGKSRRNLKK